MVERCDVTTGRESVILADIRKALGREPDLVLWRLGQGAGRVIPVDALRRLVSLVSAGRAADALTTLDQLLSARYAGFGLVRGAADLVGVLTLPAVIHRGTVHGLAGLGAPIGPPAPIGRFFALEVKAARGRTTREQDQWLEIVRKRGGFAAVVRSVDDARDALDRAREGATC